MVVFTPTDVFVSFTSAFVCLRRAQAVRPELNREKRMELRECFSLIDTDGEQ